MYFSIIIRIFLLGCLFFGLKKFFKTTIIVTIIITGLLIRDYQSSTLPVYDMSSVSQGYFDEASRKIVEEDQYIRLTQAIKEYNVASSGLILYSGLKNDYGTLNMLLMRNSTGANFTGFLKDNMLQIIAFEKELLQSTNILSFSGMLSTGVWGHVDPSKGVEYSIQDMGEGSQNLIRNLTMIGGFYCLAYDSLSGESLVMVKQKCLGYFNQASQIASRQYARRGTLISKLVAIVNIKTIFASLNNLENIKLSTELKDLIRKNLEFLGDSTIDDLIKNYKVDEYNTSFLPTLNYVSNQIEESKSTEQINDIEKIIKYSPVSNRELAQQIKIKSQKLGQYFFSLEDADQPINNLGAYLGRYIKSPSRILLALLGVDGGKYISEIISGNLQIALIPRLTGIERELNLVKDMYLKYIK